MSEEVQPRPKLNDILRNWWESASLVVRLYCGGLVIVGLGSLALPFDHNPITNGLFFTGALFLSSGFLVEAYAFGKRLWETTLGKLVGLLIGTMVAATAMGLSSQLINSATGLDPSTFPYAVAFLAPLTAGYLFLVATFFLVVASFGIALVSTLCDLVHLALTRKWVKGNVDLEVLRFLGLLALILLVTMLWNLGGRSYESALASSARWFVFTLEMYSKDDCAQKGEHVRRLSDDVVSVAQLKDREIVFTRRMCSIDSGASDNPSITKVSPRSTR